MKKLNMIKKKLNKRSTEILRNLEILTFIDNKNIPSYFEFLKKVISQTEEEKTLMTYLEKYWYKKYKGLYEYGQIIKDTIKIKNLYVSKNGRRDAENNLISKLKSLEKIYFTNNICETIHSKISKYLGDNIISKNKFRDTLNFIMNNYSVNFKNNMRRDYVTRTLIILIQKLDLNENYKFIDFDTFNLEFKKTICFMTGKVEINLVNEILNGLNNFICNNISDDDIEQKTNKSDKLESENLIKKEDLDDNTNEEEISISNIVDTRREKENFVEKFHIDIISNNIIKENEILNDDNINEKIEIEKNDYNLNEEHISIEDCKEEKLNQDSIENERDYLNIYTLNDLSNIDSVKVKLKKLLIKEDDTASLDLKFENISINKKKKNK